MSDAALRRRFAGRALLAVAGPAVATVLALGIGNTRTTAAALVYLLGVLAVATTSGLWAGIAASVLSFVGLNFFFTPPRLTLSVDKADDLIALVVFVSVAMVVSTLTARSLLMRARAERREYEARSLYAISSRLAEGNVEDALHELAEVMRALFDLSRCEVRTEEMDGSVRTRAWAGDASQDAPAVEIALATADRTLGMLVMTPGDRAFGEPERRVAIILARQIASGLERVTLEREAREARVAAEANRVRRALLSAVSHDFRTPLASIKAAITALLPAAEGDPDELLRTALEETERLEKLVANLLDLTRLRSGALSPSRAPVRIEDLLDDALAAARAALARHRVELFVRPEVPIIGIDVVQVGQALRNVLDNAAKYSPAGSEIKISVSRWHSAAEIRVADRGPGVAHQDREAIFEEFFRTGDGRQAGTGLGLAIARALVRANGGTIWVEETPGGGATIALRLPGVQPS